MLEAPFRQGALFESDDGEIIGGGDIEYDEREDWKSRLQRRTNRRRRRVDHHETRTTAAGAETLFDISWWSLFSISSIARSRSDDESVSVDVSNLPSIDCEWACDSEEEKILLQRMKLLLGPELQAVRSANLHQTYPDVYSDLRLLRFLRKSKERDFVSAADRYRSFLEWREDKDVDAIRAMVEGNGEASFTPPEKRLQAVAAYFPMNFDYVTNGNGGDDTARAILYVGLFDTAGISERIRAPESSISLKDFLDYWIYLYETIHFHLYEQTMQSGEMMFLDEVCDLSGLSIQQFSPYFVRKVMKPWLTLTQSNYPETTSRIYILNPPGIINLAWNLVTPLLSQGTVEKIRFEKYSGTADEFCEVAS
ncbi:hypothetical protein ACHAXT_002915 [Thalassiosira profunda]